SLQSGRARPALSTLLGPELKVTDAELFPKLEGDVSRLGARAVQPKKQQPQLPASVNGATGSIVKPVNAPAAALALPIPRVDPADPNAGFLAGLMATAPAELLGALAAAPSTSVETRLRQIRAWLENGDWEAALTSLAKLEDERPDDWR